MLLVLDERGLWLFLYSRLWLKIERPEAYGAVTYHSSKAMWPLPNHAFYAEWLDFPAFRPPYMLEVDCEPENDADDEASDVERPDMPGFEWLRDFQQSALADAQKCPNLAQEVVRKGKQVNSPAELLPLTEFRIDHPCLTDLACLPMDWPFP